MLKSGEVSEMTSLSEDICTQQALLFLLGMGQHLVKNGSAQVLSADFAVLARSVKVVKSGEVSGKYNLALKASSSMSPSEVDDWLEWLASQTGLFYSDSVDQVLAPYSSCSCQICQSGEICSF